MSLNPTRRYLLAAVALSAVGWVVDSFFLPAQAAADTASAGTSDADSASADTSEKPRAVSVEDRTVALRTSVALALSQIESTAPASGHAVQVDGFTMPAGWRPVAAAPKAAALAAAPAVEPPPQPTSQLTNLCVVINGKVITINEKVGDWQLVKVDTDAAYFKHIQTGQTAKVESAVQSVEARGGR